MRLRHPQRIIFDRKCRPWHSRIISASMMRIDEVQHPSLKPSKAHPQMTQMNADGSRLHLRSSASSADGFVPAVCEVLTYRALTLLLLALAATAQARVRHVVPPAYSVAAANDAAKRP